MKNTTTNTDRPETIVHGECFLFESTLPENAVKEKFAPNQPYVIVADSETTGNHHVIELNPQVEFFTADNRRFMRNSAPTNIKCLHTDRHDAIPLEPKVWEIGIAQEFDYFAEAHRNIKD